MICEEFVSTREQDSSMECVVEIENSIVSLMNYSPNLLIPVNQDHLMNVNLNLSLVEISPLPSKRVIRRSIESISDMR